MHRILAGTFAALIASACRAAVPADGKVAVGTRDSAGIAIVEHRGEPTGAVTIAATPSLSIGSPGSSDTTILFTYVKDATRLSSGTIVVLEGREARWFDSTGRHLRTTTRKGNGPGEFERTESLVRLTGDSVVVSGGAEYGGDEKQATFAPNGTFVHEERLDGARYRKLGEFGECWTQTLPDRSRLDCFSVPNPDPKRRGDDPGPGYLREMSRFVRVPTSLDRVYELGLEGGGEQTGIVMEGVTQFVSHPFGATSVAAAGGTPMRIAIATGPTYEIEVWSDTGKLERIIRRLDGRVPLTDEDRAEHERRLRGSYGRMGQKAAPADLDRIVKAVRPPDSMPGIGGIVGLGGIVVGPTGALFVTRYSHFKKGKPTIIDVFDAEGAFIATLTLPPRFRLFDAGTDYLLGVRHDDDDVPFVELYPLRRR